MLPVDTWTAQFFLGLITNFIATIAGLFVALFLRDRWYYPRRYGGWNIRVTYGETDLLEGGRTLSWPTAKQFRESLDYELQQLKSIVSPFVRLNCDLSVERSGNRESGKLLTVSKGPRRGLIFGRARYYLLDTQIGHDDDLLEFLPNWIDKVNEIRAGMGLPPLSASKPSNKVALAGSGDLLLLNFSHPLTAEQKVAIEEMIGRRIAQAIDEPSQSKVDPSKPLAPQVSAMVNRLGLAADDWQTAAIVVNPPGYAPTATLLMAELHGRMGHFPATIRLRPIPDSTPTAFEVAEVINSQTIREKARESRVTG